MWPIPGLLPQFSSFFTIDRNIDTSLSNFWWELLAACRSTGQERHLHTENPPRWITLLPYHHLIIHLVKKGLNLILPEGLATDSSRSGHQHHLNHQWSALGCSGECYRMNVPQKHPTISKWTNISDIYNVVHPCRYTNQSHCSGRCGYNNSIEGESHLTFLVATESVFEGTLK